MGAETNAATTTETTEETKQAQAPAVDGEGANKDATTTTQTEPKQDNKQQPKYTDADVDEIVSKRLAKWEKQQAAKVEEAAKLAEMNAQQKAEYERDKVQKELDEYKRRDTVNAMVAESRRQLSEQGIAVSDDILARLVGETAEETKASVDAFSAAFTAAVEDAVKKQLAGKAPAAGVATKTMTKEEILAIKDPIARQAAIRDNIGLFI
jgi:phage scaffold protein|nr:MAG TPA: Major capsid protein [Caudoviricetes sp.]